MEQRWEKSPENAKREKEIEGEREKDIIQLRTTRAIGRRRGRRRRHSGLLLFLPAAGFVAGLQAAYLLLLQS